MPSKRIAGLVVEIGGDTTKLGRALEDVDKRSRDLSKELGEVNKLLKLDPGNAELVAQKQKILAEQIDNTAKRLEILREAEDQVTAAFERGEASEEDLRAIQREVIATEQKLGGYEKAARETAGAEEELGDAAEQSAEDLEKQEKAAEEAKEELKELAAKGAEKASKAIIALGAAVSATITAIGKLVFDAAEAADELGDMSKKTGLSVEQLQKYRYTADMCGSSLETVTGAQAKLVKGMVSAQKGTGDTAKAFERLGVNVLNANGELRNADDVFMDVIDALGGVGNETERDSLAMQIFGKSAQELNPLILEGADGLREYAAEAEELGAIVSGETIDALGNMQGELKKVRAQFDATKKNVAAKFAPVVSKVLTAIQKLLKRGGELLESPKIKRSIDKLVTAFEKLIDKALDKALDLIPKVIDVVAFLVENFDKLVIALGAVWIACKGASVISSVVKGIEALTAAIGAASAASMGWAAIIAAVVAAMALLVAKGIKDAQEHFDEITEHTQAVKDKVQETLDSMKDAADEYDNAIGRSEAAASMAEGYLDRLAELESQSRLTADEQREYNELVARLQAVMPELNAEIDTETGFLKGGALALKEQVKHWKEKIKLSAVESRLKKIYEAQIDLQIAMNDAQEEYNKYHNEDVKRWLEDNDKLRQGLHLTNDELQWFATYGQNFEDGIRGWQDLETMIRESEDALNAATDAYKANVEEADRLVGVYEDVCKATNGVTTNTDSASDAVYGLAQALGLTGDEAKEFAEEHAQKVISAAQSMFSEIETKSDLTMQKITETLKHNYQALQEYENNLRIIAERGASKAALEYLEGLGIEQAGVISVIAKSTDEEFADFIHQFDKNTAAAYSAGKNWGKQSGAGIVDGMDSKESAIKKAGARAARALAKAFTNILEIKSPSRLFGRFARFSAQGYINDFERMTPRMAETSAKGAKAIAESFDPQLGNKLSTLDRSLRGPSQASTSAASTAANTLMSKLDTIVAAIKAGRVILLDGDTLVGATADRMDATLGQKAVTTGRMVLA